MFQLKLGDTVQVEHDGKKLVGEIVEVGRNSPQINHVMVSGIYWWFPIWKCKILKFAK